MVQPPTDNAEVFSSTNDEVLCGRAILGLGQVVFFIDGLTKHSIHSECMAGIGTERSIYLGYQSVQIFELLKRHFQPAGMIVSEPFILAELLLSTRERIATRAIEKVYGALAIMPPKIQKSMVVDISMTQRGMRHFQSVS